MKVLLINPEEPASVKLLSTAYSRMPSLGLAYIAAYLIKNGIETIILDNNVEHVTDNEIQEFLKQHQPDLVGITAVSLTINNAYKIASIVKNYNYKIKIIMGGHHVDALPEETLRNPNIDFIVKNEGEQTMLELVKSIRERDRLEDVKGIVFRADKEIFYTKPRPLIEDLDSLPMPAYHLLPMNKYFLAATRKMTKGYDAAISTSRGCPFQCIFCSRNIFGNRVRFRTPKNIIDEISYLIDKYNVRNIVIVDDTFTINKNHVIEICELICKKNLKFFWTCFGRVDSPSYEMYKIMYKAGCREISFGIESGSQEILNTIKKGTTLQQAEEAVKLCKKAGLLVQCSFIFGIPGETIQTAKETIEFVKRLNPDFAIFCVLIPMPGSELFDAALDRRIINIDDYKKYSVLFLDQPPPLTMCDLSVEQLYEIQKKANREFYLRPNFILYKLSRIRCPEDINQDLRGLQLIIKQQFSKTKIKRF